MEEFTTEDVYIIINTALMEKNYPLLDLEEKKKIVTECFTNYFIYKLAQLSGKVKDNLSLRKLFSLIEVNIPEEKRLSILADPIRCLLSIISCLQNFEISWKINEDQNDVHIVTNNEGKFELLVTSEHPEMSSAFNVAYQYFMKRLTVNPSSINYNLERQIDLF